MNEDTFMLKEISDRLIAGTSLDFKRYLYPKIDWRNRFVCLKGAKGTGKTTTVSSPSQGDFLVDGEWLFEVGGKGKKFTQIKDVPNSYVAYDDVEIGVGNKIPLWLFGFLY